VILSVWVSWSLLNWMVAFAALFAVAENRNTLDAIGAAVEFCSRRTPAVLAVSAWFGFAHIASLVFTISAMVFSLSFVSVLPAGYACTAALLILLAYFLVVDFLRIGRLAAYIALLEEPEARQVVETDPIHPDPGSGLRRNPVDPDELILSDIPAPAQ
jgi:hypothetical protein